MSQHAWIVLLPVADMAAPCGYVIVLDRCYGPLARIIPVHLTFPENYRGHVLHHIGNSPELPRNGWIPLLEPNQINRMSDWDIDFRQIEAGKMQSAVRLCAGRAVKLIEIRMSRSVHQTGQSPAGEISVGIVRPGQIESWQGQDLTSTSLVCFGSGAEFDGIGASRFQGLTVSAKIRSLESAAQAFGLDLPEWLLAPHTPKCIGLESATGDLKAIANRLFAATTTALPREREDSILLNILLAAMGDSSRATPASPRTRARALSRAMEIMTDHEAENLRIGSICQETGVSWRTLDRAFKERFGIGPKRYYLQLRLSRVRSDLLGAGQHRMISDAANVHGFWHLGEFAMEYFRLFGELPSDTVASRKIV